MPKNWGENTKSAQAKARKDAIRRDETDRKQKEAEDKYWEDNDKHVVRKQQRKEEADKKHTEKLQKKEEAKKILEEETKGLKSAKPERHETTSKVTKFEIDRHKETQEELAAQAKAKAELERKKITEQEPELVENVNRIQIDGDVARNVDEAISILTGAKSDADLHPEKRMRAAYLEFEEENLERLKKENPNMRLSQIRQMLKKDWQKSPKNPMNKIF